MGWKGKERVRRTKKNAASGSEAAFNGGGIESVALGQVGFRWARAHGQQGGAADTDEQRTEKHGDATQQRKAAGGAKDLADGNGGNGGLDEGQRGGHGMQIVQLRTI